MTVDTVERTLTAASHHSAHELADSRLEPIRRPHAEAPAPRPVFDDTAALEGLDLHDEDALYRRAVTASEAIKNPRSRGAYLRLVLEAKDVARARGLSRHATEITFFTPGEALQRDVLVRSRTTMYRYRLEWKALGLVDSRAHTTTAFGKNVKDGIIWTVRFRFNPRKPARVRHEHLAHQGYRDLEEDIKHGRTAYAQLHTRKLKQSDTPRERRDSGSLTMYWALPPAESSAPLPLTVSPDGDSSSSTQILDLRSAGRRDRGRLVDQVANAIARELGDHRSLNFYRWTLWQLLRLLDTGSDLLDAMLLQIQRAKADHNERFARRAGALLQSRLKAGGILDAIRSQPRNRVGAAPERA